MAIYKDNNLHNIRSIVFVIKGFRAAACCRGTSMGIGIDGVFYIIHSTVFENLTFWLIILLPFSTRLGAPPCEGVSTLRIAVNFRVELSLT